MPATLDFVARPVRLGDPRLQAISPRATFAELGNPLRTGNAS
jgi:hypothetical protein